MSKFDKQYLELCRKILKEGTKIENRTGVNTTKLPFHLLEFDLKEEFPILTTKKVNWEVATLEMMWIYLEKSNDVRWLNERGIKLWDAWSIDPDGFYRTYVDAEKTQLKSEKYFGEEWAHTIGTAYGWINNKMNQPNKAINTLKTGPTDPAYRRNIISLWQDDYLDTAVLPSCVWNVQFDVTGNKLTSIVTQRSCDVPLGLPFNVTQYAMLTHMLAHVTGLEVDKMYFSIKDVHIYDNQIDGIQEQVRRYEELGDFPAPKLWLNPEVDDFFAFDTSRELKDTQLEEYKHHGPIKMKVMV